MNTWTYTLKLLNNRIIDEKIKLFNSEANASGCKKNNRLIKKVMQVISVDIYIKLNPYINYTTLAAIIL